MKKLTSQLAKKYNLNSSNVVAHPDLSSYKKPTEGVVGRDMVKAHLDGLNPKETKEVEEVASNTDNSPEEVVTKSSAAVGQMVATNEGKPADDMQMRKIYALLGKTYPRDPNEMTADIKNYKFLSPLVGKDMAYDAVFGKTGNKSLSRVGKTIRDAKDAYASGDKEAGDILMKSANKQADKRTSSQYGRDEARSANKDLMNKGQENWTNEDFEDYQANNEVIEGYEDTAKEQNWNAETKKIKQGRTKADNALQFLKKNPTDKRAMGDLEDAQSKLRQGKPKTYQDEKKQIEELKGKQVSLNQTADVLNRINHGDLQAIERGAVDTLKQWMSTKIDRPTEEFLTENLGEGWKDTTEANLKQGTSLGLLQAAFIKSISGATVTDQERADLVKTMVGGGGMDNEKALKTALTEFYESGKESMGYSADQLSKGTSPYDAFNYGKVKGLGEEFLTERGKASPSRNGKKVARTGTNAQGQKVVEYEDGTREVL